MSGDMSEDMWGHEWGACEGHVGAIWGPQGGNVGATRGDVGNTIV